MSKGVYEELLGSSWDSLPDELKSVHSVRDMKSFSGRAVVERGTNPLSRLVCFIMNMPEAGEDIPVSFTISIKNGQERWVKTFNGKSFSSVQRAGKNSCKGLLVERVGPLFFAIELQYENGLLKLLLRRWMFLGIPLPMFLAIKTHSYEHAQAGRFYFNADISHPLMGKIVHYKGWLNIEDDKN